MAEPLRLHPLTVDEFHAMGEAGILTEDDRIELIDGQLVEQMPIGAKHIRIVNVLTRLAVQRAADVVEVSIQNPVELDLYNEPLPDVVLLRVDRDVTKVPSAKDVMLLVEVADSSVMFDTRIKLPHYAEVGIQEVWIVNIPDERIECYRHPSPSGYATTRFLTRNDNADAELVPELGRIPVELILEG